MSTATAVSTGTWTIDPTHTEIGFSVRHLVSKVRGKFEAFEGTIVTNDDVTASTVNVTVDLNSINTGTTDRDNHLRSADFFEVETHPKMTFVSTDDRPEERHRVRRHAATSRSRASASPSSSKTEFLGEGGDPWGGTRVGIEATTEISRKEFGIDFNIPLEGGKVMVGDRISIHINAEAVLQA